jgi:GTPase SAR1 family protein
VEINEESGEKKVLLFSLYLYHSLFYCYFQAAGTVVVESVLRDNRSVPWNRSKIMLVGQGRAGKTALANSMMGKEFIPDTMSTFGAEKFERKLVSGKIKKGEKGAAILKGYVSSSKELESMMAQAASTQMYRPERGISMEDEITAENTSSLPTSVNVTDVDTAIFNKCLSENIKRSGGNSELVISLYDFGGQDIFNVLHPFFMSRYGVYVVVFDMELFLSKDTEKRESCMKHLKFWMNSIVMHTYDEEIGKTAPVAIVGTRGDVISNNEDHEVISRLLKENFYLSVAWQSLLVDHASSLCFFPVNNVEQSGTVTQLLEVCQSFLEKADFVKLKVPFVWLKILDEMKEKRESFLTVNAINEMCFKFKLSSEGIVKMLTFFGHMGIFIWINEGKLRDIVILDPIEYFVKPATMIICKHIATKDDPYHTVHCEEIHKACRKRWSDYWYQLLEFGLVSEELATGLLQLACKDLSHVKNVLLLMERYSLSSSLLYHSQITRIVGSALYFVPAVAPSDPQDYFLDEKLFDDFSDYMRYKNLIGCLGAKRKACCDKFDESFVFHFAFSVSADLVKCTLVSAHDVAVMGFLPNGLFERFIGKICGSLLSAISDMSAFLKRNNFIAFKDIVKLTYMFRRIKFRNLLENNMIRVEIEKNPKDAYDSKILMFIHDSLFEMIQMIIRECYKNLLAVTLLPTDFEYYHDRPLLLLSELKSVTAGSDFMIDYHSEDGQQTLSTKVEDLRRLFSVWLDVATIHPKKGEYSNKVFIVLFLRLLVILGFVGNRKAVFCFPFS